MTPLALRSLMEALVFATLFTLFAVAMVALSQGLSAVTGWLPAILLGAGVGALAFGITLHRVRVSRQDG